MNKNVLFILTILMVLCTLSAASASEINGTDDVVDSDCDILSASPASTVTVSTWSDLSNACTNSTQYDIIYVNGNMAPSSAITINKNVVIEGVNGSYIGGTSSNFVTYSNIPFSTSSALNVTFKNMNFQYTGGNILMKFGGNGNYVLDGCTFKNITAVGVQKSVVHLYYGLGNIVDCTFENCTTSYGVVTNCYSTSETTVNRARMYVSNCEFRNNNATIEPGAINNCGYLEVYDSIFENNYATQWAGAIHTHIFANTTIVNSTFRNNRAGWNGGSLFTYSYLQVYNSTFTENQADAFGGAIGACKYAVKNWMGVWINSTYTILIKNSQFISNSASTNGGAIGVMDEGILRVQNNIFTNNVASTGRAISASDSVIYEDNWTDITSPTVEIIGNQFYDPTSTLPNVLVYGVDATYLLDNNAFYLSSSPSGFNEPLLGLSQDEVLGDGNSPAQWAQEGADAQNTGISPYAGIINGELSWNYTPSSEGNINSLLITNDGQIFTTTTDGYVIRLSNSGNQNTKGKPRDQNMQFAITNIYGVALDNNNYFILPSANTENTEGNYIQSWGTDVAFDNMQTLFPYLIDGTYLPVWNYEYENAYLSNFNPVFDGSNMWVIGDNGQYYVMKYAYVLCPDPSVAGSDMYYYKWDTSLNLNNIGKPLSSLVKSNDGKSLWINTENGIEGYDISTSTASKYAITSVNAVGRPIIDANDVVYFIGSDDKLYAYTTAGEKWSTEISGGAGSLLALGKDGNIYTVSKEGFLLQFSPDGDDTSLYEIGTNASTIMTDANGIIYVGSDDGKFYAFDDEGNQKWMVDTESASAVKNCAMDNEGNIYFYTAENKIYAINEAPAALKNLTIEVTVPEGEFTTMDNVTITATLNETTEGNVTFTVGDLTKTVNITGNVAEWTTKLPGGNQTITATFGGNDEFATATNTTDVEISKVDVEFVNVPEKVNMEDYASFEFNLAYNNTIAVVKSDNFKVYKDDEELELYNGYDLYGDNGNFNLDLWEFNSGKYNMTIAFAGDDSYNPVNITFALNVVPKLSVNSKVDEDKIIVNVNVGDSVYPYETLSDATGKFTVTTNNETLAEGIIDQGIGSVSFNKLEPGTYELTVVYDEGNYPENNVTISLFVPKTSQWAVTGYDYKNSGKNNYTRLDGVEIIWVNNQTINFNANPLRDDFGQFMPDYSAVIDSEGIIYITDGKSVYALNDDGTLKYSTGGSRNGGLSLMYDFILFDSVTIDTIRIFDTATRANLVDYVGWSTSSRFPVAIGPDGRVYITSTYGDNMGTGNWIVVLKYENGKFSFDTSYYQDSYTGSSRGGFGLTKVSGTPVFTDDGIMWVSTRGSIGAADISNGKVLFTSLIGVSGRPVVDDANIVYYLGVDNNIHAVNLEGFIWNATITGTIGTTLAVGDDYLYAVNAEGVLYKYSKNDGSESLVADLGSAGQSIIVDANNNIYVSTANGDVYAFDSDDSQLWTINLGSAIIGKLAMNKNGIIYAYTADALYALGYPTELDIASENLTVFDDEVITVTVLEGVTGNITFKLGYDSFEIPINETTATLNLGRLPAGNYTVIADYAGNNAFASANVNTTFEIKKVNPDISEVSIEDNTVTVKLPENATGNVFLDVDGVGYYAPIENGEAVINIPELKPGTYEATLTYPGDENYNNASTTFDIEVPDLLDPELEVSVKDTEITITINENATGKIIATVGEISYVKDAADAPIVIDVSDLESGEYDVTVEYMGDEKFNNATATAEVTVPEVEPLDPELEVSVDGTVVTVSLNADATGYIVVGVDGDSIFFEYEGSPIVVDCADYLDPGKYTVDVTYSGDEFFAEANTTAEVTVPEVEPLDPELEVSVDGTVVTVSLNADATGYIVATVDGDSIFFEYEGSPIVVDCADYLDPGKYTVDVTYSGDDVFASDNASVEVTVPEVELLNPELKVNIENTTITVSINEKATGDVIITVGDISFVQSADELTPIDVSDYLTNGTYSVTVRYVGDENFTESVLIGGSVTVPSEPVIEPKDPNLKASAVNNTITVNVDKDATGNVLVDVDGQGYYAPIKNGQATVNVIGLDEGTYEATVTYVGDEAYKAANTTVAVTVPKKEDPTPKPVDPDADIEVTNTTASISLPKDATGYMLVDVDGKGYYAPVKDGKASIDLPELAPGNHTVTVTYTGDNKYKSANATETVTIDEEIETIIAEDLTKVEKAPDRFEARFTDADGKTLANAEVTFTINGMTYTRTTDADGKASIGVNLDAGNYTILVTNTVTKESKELKINVLSRFAVHNDLTKYFRNATQYVVKILDDEGNPAKAGESVIFNINGVFYNRTADANGNVKLNINLNPGDYIITAEYKGCRVSNNIKVLPVLTGKDLTKKFGQPDQFEATLVDGQGKAYANQKVTFNINGVFYTRTTDSNGVAKLNINLQPGQYIITSYYNEAVTSNTVTVTA